MSHSSTFTSSYALAKYSRSYPVKRMATLKTSLPNAKEPQMTPEWQHFTNPVIRLLLDVKMSSQKELESVRLRIIWEMNSGLDDNQGQPVVFEDMELLAFAQMVPALPKKQQAEGLPLKAVYRDTVVGIRYLHNRDQDTPVYRRFQVSFESASEASQFIDNIKTVCPCKLNPLPVAAPPPPQKIFQGIQQSQSISHASHHNPMLPNRGTSFMYAPPVPQTAFPRSFTTVQNHFPASSASSPPGPPSTAIPPPPSSSFMFSSSPLRHELSSEDLNRLSLGTSSPRVMVDVQQVAEVHAPPLAEPINRQLLTRLESATSSTTESVTLPGSSAPSSLPRASSLSQAPNTGPSSSASASAPSTAAPLPRSEQSSALSPVLESVSQATSIYDLSSSELEKLVGEILSEDGFYELLDKVSQMIIVRRVADA